MNGMPHVAGSVAPSGAAAKAGCQALRSVHRGVGGRHDLGARDAVADRQKSLDDKQTKLAAKKLQAAEEEAYALRMQAEETFDEADRRMSTRMACDGARQAIEAWEQREKYIRKMETLGRKQGVGL